MHPVQLQHTSGIKLVLFCCYYRLHGNKLRRFYDTRTLMARSHHLPSSPLQGRTFFKDKNIKYQSGMNSQPAISPFLFTDCPHSGCHGLSGTHDSKYFVISATASFVPLIIFKLQMLMVQVWFVFVRAQKWWHTCRSLNTVGQNLPAFLQPALGVTIIPYTSPLTPTLFAHKFFFSKEKALTEFWPQSGLFSRWWHSSPCPVVQN